MERYRQNAPAFRLGTHARSTPRGKLPVCDPADARHQLIAARGTVSALRTVSQAVQDWGGGTRIGEALRAFNLHWARRMMSNGPVVLIVSDGWDRGDPALLAREIARVQRSCRRLVWLNRSSVQPTTSR